MDEIEIGSESLACVASGSLSTTVMTHTVRSLEQALLSLFPASDAESWDRTGLLVGNPLQTVKGVAIALDPTVDAINAAADAGANVLITHHPAFLSAPDSFIAASSVAPSSGAGVWAAARRDVALMSFHTTLDVSEQAQHVLPGMLSLSLQGTLERLETNPHKGYGQICTLQEEALTLGQLASRCTSVFGRTPRVWGDLSQNLNRIVTCTGALGSVGRKALVAGIDCVVCGEVKYHEALDLSCAGLALIDIGHDTSELPLVSVLVHAVKRVGVDPELVVMLNQGDNWTYPETVRV